MTFAYRNQVHLSTLNSGCSLSPNPPPQKSQIKMHASFGRTEERTLTTSAAANPNRLSHPWDTSVAQETTQPILTHPTRSSPQFKSQTTRFVATSAENKAPGPGYYDVDTKHTQTRPRPTHQQDSQLRSLLRMFHQIKPVHPEDLNFGNACTKKEEANLSAKLKSKSSQKARQPDYMFKSSTGRQIIPRPQTSIGPGSYDSSKRPIRPNNSLKNDNKWSKVDRTKFLTLSSSSTNLGPGYYENVSKPFVSQARLAKTPQCFGSKINRFPTSNKSKYEEPAKIMSKESDASAPIKKVASFLSTVSKQLKLASSHSYSLTKFSIANSCLKHVQSDDKFQFGSRKPRFQKISHQTEFNSQQNNNKSVAEVEVGDLSTEFIIAHSISKPESQIQPAILKPFDEDTVKRPIMKRAASSADVSRSDDRFVFQTQKPIATVESNNIVNTLGSTYANKKQIQAPFMSGCQRFNKPSPSAIDEFWEWHQKTSAVLTKKSVPKKGCKPQKKPILHKEQRKFKESCNDQSNLAILCLK